MFRSIRWRLVASYVLLTLLTVSLVGVLALSLIRRYVEQQERDYLTANAEVVARQALPLMQPVLHVEGLHDLTQAASFLGNARVRILDSHRRMLADSGAHLADQEFVWIVTPIGYTVQASHARFERAIMVLSGRRVPWPGVTEDEALAIFEQLPSGTEFSFVRRMEGPWGARFHFGPRLGLEMMTELAPEEADLPLLESLPDETVARSERVITVPIGEGDRPLGHVELSGGPDFVTEALSTARRALLLAAGGATLLAVIVGLLVGQGLSAPLRNLTETASQMSSGDLSMRVSVRGRDEIGQLAQQFNRMTERLEASFAQLAAERDSLRHFIADASHELRTPITALRNFNELLQGAAADDPAARDEFLAESGLQLDRLEWITHNLLDLSRIEAGLTELDVAHCDVKELIEAAASPFMPLAHEKGITLSVVSILPTPLTVPCDRRRIEMALGNLLDNGLKFTPAGGWVAVGAEQAGQMVRLWVHDSGPGIDPADLPHVFERFYRGKDDRVQGTGLGLAIVRSLIRAHGGRVTAESELSGGSRFVIELPLAGQGADTAGDLRA